jgi:hypothetical protein
MPKKGTRDLKIKINEKKEKNEKNEPGAKSAKGDNMPRGNGNNPMETIEFINALITVWITRVKIWEDRKFGIDDIGYVFAAIPTITRGIIGMQYIDDERRELTDEGREKIKEAIKEFEPEKPDEEIERLVEEYLMWIDHTFEIGLKTIDYLKKK